MTDPKITLLLIYTTYILIHFTLPFKKGINWNRKTSALLIALTLASLYGTTTLLFFFLSGAELKLSIKIGAALGVFSLALSSLTEITKSTRTLKLLVEVPIQLLAVLAAWLTLEGYWSEAVSYISQIPAVKILTLAIAYLSILHPTSAIIGAILGPLLRNLDNTNSIKNAGTHIGYLERTLIVTFVLLSQWEAIGFLLTAKSILRFNELKNGEHRPTSEYVLLGTLLSFTISIMVGLAANALLKPS